MRPLRDHYHDQMNASLPLQQRTKCSRSHLLVMHLTLDFDRVHPSEIYALKMGVAHDLAYAVEGVPESMNVVGVEQGLNKIQIVQVKLTCASHYSNVSFKNKQKL